MSGKTGFRQQKESTAKQQLKELHTTVANIQQAMNIQKIVFEQFANGFGKLDADMHNAMGVLNDLQYRTLALVELAGDKEAIDKIAETMKLRDYNEASAKEDIEKGFIEDDLIKKDSIVVLTSVCEQFPDKSIFRTKFKLDEEPVIKDVKDQLIGLKVGDKVDVKLPDGLDHTLEIVGVKKHIAAEPPIEQNSSITDQVNVTQ